MSTITLVYTFEAVQPPAFYYQIDRYPLVLLVTVTMAVEDYSCHWQQYIAVRGNPIHIQRLNVEDVEKVSCAGARWAIRTNFIFHLSIDISFLFLTFIDSTKRNLLHALGSCDMQIASSAQQIANSFWWIHKIVQRFANRPYQHHLGFIIDIDNTLNDANQLGYFSIVSQFG